MSFSIENRITISDAEWAAFKEWLREEAHVQWHTASRIGHEMFLTWYLKVRKVRTEATEHGPDIG